MEEKALSEFQITFCDLHIRCTLYIERGPTLISKYHNVLSIGTPKIISFPFVPLFLGIPKFRRITA